ncbi:hypothetical protein [Micromonospora sp. NPDC023956]|uniref:hypothetical protein n=1 Tax=Micromonospora sp. NPDC023956 TaxID=3155722 RepID=UPI00340543C8
MAKKLRMFVTVHERDGDGNPTGRSGTFGPDDSLPGWAQAGITNPDVWEDGPAAEPGPPRPSAGGDDPAPGGGRAGDGPPPKGGPGSDADAWREYAASKGVEVPAGAKRPAIIAALEAAGVRTE